MPTLLHGNYYLYKKNDDNVKYSFGFRSMSITNTHGCSSRSARLNFCSFLLSRARNFCHAISSVATTPFASAKGHLQLPNLDAGGPIHDGEIAQDESNFKETARFRVCPREGTFGLQVPQAAWHSVVVHEPSTILEAKDGPYIPPK